MVVHLVFGLLAVQFTDVTLTSCFCVYSQETRHDGEHSVRDCGRFTDGLQQTGGFLRDDHHRQIPRRFQRRSALYIARVAIEKMTSYVVTVAYIAIQLTVQEYI